MHITMNRTEFGSPDGIKVVRFVEGQTYDVDVWPMSRELARSFLQAKVAELVKDVSSPTENKDDASLMAAKTKKENATHDGETSSHDHATETHSSKKSHKS